MISVLHVAAHLGGGIGRAHAAINRVMDDGIDQTFVVLEDPVDDHYVADIQRRSRVVVAGRVRQVQELVDCADIVQFEFWGHPALTECYRELKIPHWVKTTCWAHVSGRHPPLFDQDLRVDRFITTSPISGGVSINSGFGFSSQRGQLGSRTGVYLGTVDFKKMHSEVFRAVDRSQFSGSIEFFGRTSLEVEASVLEMNHRDRISLRGYTRDPVSVLSRSSIFFYPLRPDHYGTAENALVEAMSMGLVPIVLDNPAEREIVEPGYNGLVASSIEEAVLFLEFLSSAPLGFVGPMSERAVSSVANRRPWDSARQLATVWRSLVLVDHGVQQGASCSVSPM